MMNVPHKGTTRCEVKVKIQCKTLQQIGSLELRCFALKRPRQAVGMERDRCQEIIEVLDTISEGCQCAKVEFACFLCVEILRSI